MITLFSTCKPFRGVYEHIQQNALHSWALLKPRPDVILFGNDAGTAKAARMFKFQHVTKIHSRSFKERYRNKPTSRATKPNISDMFRIAEKMSTGNLLVYVNADILLTNLTSEFLRVSQRLSRFLLIGQRYNVSVNKLLRFGKSWSGQLHPIGKLHPPCGIDYIAFTKGLWGSLPDFTVGYIGFDNYLVSTALERGIPVVDGTKTILAYHQIHPIRQRMDTGDRHNLNTWGSMPWQTHGFISDATWVLDNDGVRKK